MKSDYIILSNGIKYRIEANFNSLITFCSSTGISDLSQLDGIANISIEKVPALIHACIAEGERMDGREFNLSETDLSALFRITTVGDFFKIYAAQSRVSTNEVAPSEKKRARGWLPFRKRSR